MNDPGRSDPNELFEPDWSEEPLAARMRPRTVDEFVGQEHILGEGRLLRRAIQADMLSSVIFSGPPGTGKTTLARVIANTTRSTFLSLNAVLSGVKDVRAAIEKAREYRKLYGRKTTLFVDEVHRWNKAQQDALLPWVENGTVVLIGATTENPFFEVNAALVSRSRIFQLKPLSKHHLYAIARKALSDHERGYGHHEVRIEEDALDHLVQVADGDARSLLNALQLAVETTPSTFPPPPDEPIHITREVAEDSIQRKAVLYDKEGDYHFDSASAFIKSLRGSDADAALYWLARMVAGGEDPRFLFRRMLILASEDVGLADPRALAVVEAAAAAFDRVGMPEGQFHLAHAALYLAGCPKSNSTLGYYDALAAVEEERREEVPKHLRDPNRDAKGFGHGEGYLYPHAYRDHWVAQNYLPAALRDRVFYRPTDQGWEGELREMVERRRDIRLSLLVDQEEEFEALSYTPTTGERERRLNRLAAVQREMLADLRDELTRGLKRHETVLVGGSSPLPTLWEAVRRTPEGGVYAAVTGVRAAEAARAQAEALPEPERPRIFHGEITELVATSRSSGPAGSQELPSKFDRILGRNLLVRGEDPTGTLASLAARLVAGGRLAAAENLPTGFRRLSDIARGAGLASELVAAVERAEEALFADPKLGFAELNTEALEKAAMTAGLADVSVETREYRDLRVLGPGELSAWIFGRGDGNKRGYPAFLAARLSAEQLDELYHALSERLQDQKIDWPLTVAVLRGLRPQNE